MKLELTRNRQKKRFFQKLFPSSRKLDFNLATFELLIKKLYILEVVVHVILIGYSKNFCYYIFPHTKIYQNEKKDHQKRMENKGNMTILIFKP